MKHYEHRAMFWGPHTLPEMAERLGPEWKYCGPIDDPEYGAWVREIPAPEPAALLMEISHQLSALASEVDGAAERLSRLADCISGLALGQSVTLEDVTGKPSN